MRNKIKGTLTLSNNYTYVGEIRHNEPHGYGVFEYINGHKYEGHCVLGQPDGYGVYTFNESKKYSGYFSCGKFHGIGTYEDEHAISKGTWRNDEKHGYFLETNKVKFASTRQLWTNGKIRATEGIQYMAPELLYTTKENPAKNKKRQINFKAVEKKCVACNIDYMNAAVANCGHVCMCYECLSKCGNKCPICRGPINRIIKLYVS